MANLRANKITSTEVFETTGSVQFVRVPTSRLTTDLGSGLGDNFTIEFWIIANGIASGSSSPGMFQLSDTSGGLKASTESLALAWSTSNNYSIFYAGSLGTGSITNDPNTNDVWKHYAMVRSNGVLKIYVDGIEKTSANVTDDFSGYRYLSIGTYYSTSYPWQGHISNFRILKGTALYTKNFTPPTRELTVISNTVLLACQSTTNTAQEATGKTITVNGNAVANELTPGLLTDVVKSGGTSAITGSVEFDGTDNTLTIPNNADFNFGSGDSTIEMWVYPTRISATQENLITRGTSGYSGFIMSVTNFLDTTSGSNWDIDITYTNPLVANSWQHIAVCRNGNTWTVYINGIANGTATASGAVLSSAQTLTIGERIGQTDYQGFISNLRVVKGTALYTSNFIPPTRELKNIPGTVLLCCKDSNDPTAEETGKTITANGDPTGSNFTPQVGSDGSVEFAGPTKINSENYFYLPTGNTESRGRGRGLFGGGENITNIIDYITIATTGNAQDFGDLTQARRKLTSFSSSTRGIFGDGGSPGATDIIDYVTIATTGNALDFGDTTQDCVQSGGCSNQIRGLFGGGYNVAPTVTGLIQYVTIATKGDTISFGDLTQERFDVAGCASPTRGIFGGGKNTPISENFDIIDYVTIMSTGNAVDFGNLTVGRRNPVSCSSTVRGLFAGGFATPLFKNEIDYITIASTGNAQDFGDLTVAKQEMNAGLSDNVRGVFGGGQVPSAPIRLNSIDYVTIASTGNAQDFGDLTGERNSSGSASDSHGGLG